MSQKAKTFDHIKDVLNSRGKMFGTTILGKGINHNFLAKKLLTIYNSKKIMNNINDDKETLLNELQNRFSHVQLKVVGCTALFVAM